MFTPNRELLNVNFEGYKLSETPLKQLKADLPDGVKRKRLDNDCFSYQHMRQATMSNLLINDRWTKSGVVYWVSNDNKIMTASLHASGDSVNVQCIFEDKRSCVGVASSELTTPIPSLFFLSSTHALFFNPTSTPGNILLLDTDDSSTTSDWSIASEIVPPINEFIIESAHMSNSQTIDILISSLQPITTASPHVDCTLQLFQATLPDHTSQSPAVIDNLLLWKHTSSTAPLYCELLSDTVLVITESDLRENSCDAKEEKEEEKMDVSVPNNHSGLGYSLIDTKYTWTQTHSDVTVTIPLPDDVTKRDVSCVIEREGLVAGLTDGTTYIRGTLYRPIDIETSTWTFEKNKLEVILEKAESNVEWAELLSTGRADGGKGKGLPLDGEMLGLTEEEMRELEDRIDKMSNEGDKAEGKRGSCGLTSPAKRLKPIMHNTMEECDEPASEEVQCLLVNKDGDIINKTVLGDKELLFIRSPSTNSPTYICLKHDVDAVLFSLDSSTHTNDKLSVAHTSTFNALGYVQASKREKKFLTCDSSHSYAILTDCNRHVFVYLQPSDGIKCKSALQYVHTLSSVDEIVGVCAAGDGVIYVLCERVLAVLVLP